MPAVEFASEWQMLLEGVFGEAFAANLEVVHVGRNIAAQVLVDIQFGKILAKHKAVAAEAGAETHLGIDDVARLGIAAGPNGKEAHFAKVGDPFGKDFGHNLKKFARVVLDILTGFVAVAVGRSTADNLSGVTPLLAVYGREAFVVTAVDNHIEGATIGTHHGQAAGDESLVLDGVEAGVEVELVDKLLGAPAHGIHEMVAGVFDKLTLVVADQSNIMASHLLDVEQFAILEITAAELGADSTQIVNHAAGSGLPAVAGDESVRVGVARVVPQRRNFAFEILAVDHIGIAPSAGSIERAVSGVVVNEIYIMGEAVVDIGLLLQILENLVVVDGDIGDIGVGESRTAAADTAPGGAAGIVNHYGMLASLGEIAEERAAGDTAASDEHLDTLAPDIVHLREHENLVGAGVEKVAQSNLVGQRGAGRGVAYELDAIGTKNLAGAGNAAFASAGTHAQAGDVLKLVDRNGFAVAKDLEHAVETDVLAMAYISLAGFGSTLVQRMELERLGIILAKDKTFDIGVLDALVSGGHLHAGEIGFIGFAYNLLDAAFAHLGAIIVDKEHLGTFGHLVFDGKETEALGDIVAENSQTGAGGDTLHAADALVVIDRRRGGSGGLGDGPLRAGEGAGIASETIEAVGLDEGFQLHAFGGGKIGFLEQANGVLLRIDILARDIEVIVVIIPDADGLSHLVGSLAATENGTSALANANGIAHAISILAEHLAALGEQLVVGNQAGADIDDIDIVDNPFGAGDGFEIFTLGYYGAGDACTVGIGNGAQEGVTRHDGDAEAAEAVGLDGEAALAGHGLDDGANMGASLHALVRSKIADIASTYGEDALAEEGVFLVHHLLEHGGGVHARNIVVFESRHERNGACGYHQVVGIDIGNIARLDILDGYAAALEQIPNGAVEENALVAIASQGACDIETAHAAETLFLFEKEKLVGLHIELAADAGVIVNHQIVDTESVELLAAGEAGGAGTNNGHLGFVNLHIARLLGNDVGNFVDGRLYVVHFMYTIDKRNTNTAYLAVDHHFASSTLADAAVEAAVATLNAVAVDGETCLVESGGNGVAFATLDWLTIINEFYNLALRNVEDWVLIDFEHSAIKIK